MEREVKKWQFDGFSSPNFTSVPDEFFDVLAPRLSGSEVKVLLYIIRRTFGFKKDRDNISLSQMLNGIVKKNGERLDYGTGMSKPSVCRALISLAEKRIITSTRQFDFKGGCVATSYQLNSRGHGVRQIEKAGAEAPGKKMRQGVGSQNFPRGVSQNLARPLVKKRDTQYTVNNKQFDNNVNVSIKGIRRSPLHSLEDRKLPIALANLIAEDILAVLGDKHSEAFYRLVARKVPETFVRRTLSEVKQGGAESAPKVFTAKIMEYTEDVLASKRSATLKADRKALFKKYTNP